ncbi:hypothetical protein Leryth_000897 [Lithospermum erythrorhizon]|nr:hypothetical protein Leryth_000897 [Lithospermum erythrorhizon]
MVKSFGNLLMSFSSQLLHSSIPPPNLLRLKMRVHFGHIIRKKQGKDSITACMRSMKMKWKEWYGSPESSIILPLFC